jgi:hypothetical protein
MSYLLSADMVTCELIKVILENGVGQQLRLSNYQREESRIIPEVAYLGLSSCYSARDTEWLL